jgi:hypothetical protein
MESQTPDVNWMFWSLIQRETNSFRQWRWSCPLAIGSNYSFEAPVGPICFSFSPSRTSAVLNIWVLHRPASCCARNGPLRHRQSWPWLMSWRAAGRLHCKAVPRCLITFEVNRRTRSFFSSRSFLVLGIEGVLQCSHVVTLWLDTT